MNVMRWGYCALASCFVGLAACADRPTAPALERTGVDVPSVPSGPFAQLVLSDAAAIPVGSPARVEFFGQATASRRTLTFPLRTSVDGDQLRQTAISWLARTKQVQADGVLDPVAATAAQRVERLLAARTPEEIRGLLGPSRKRVADARSLRSLAGGHFEHTVSFRLDGRELLRVVANARRATSGPQFNCVDDPDGREIDPGCPGADPGDDPNFDPAQVAADLAAMQAEVDAMSAELAAAEESAGGVRGECEAARGAFVTASLAFALATGEALYFAWRRDIPNTYRSTKNAAIAFGAAYLAFKAYQQCIAPTTRPRL